MSSISDNFVHYSFTQNRLEYAFIEYISYHLLFYFKSKTEIISNVSKYVFCVDLASACRLLRICNCIDIKHSSLCVIFNDS